MLFKAPAGRSFIKGRPADRSQAAISGGCGAHISARVLRQRPDPSLRQLMLSGRRLRSSCSRRSCLTGMSSLHSQYQCALLCAFAMPHFMFPTTSRLLCLMYCAWLGVDRMLGEVGDGHLAEYFDSVRERLERGDKE